MKPDFDSLPPAIREALTAKATDSDTAASGCDSDSLPAHSGAPGNLSEADRALRYVGKVPAIGEGRRNQTVYALAFRLCEMFKLTKSEVQDACRAWNERCTPPIEDKEFSATVGSAVKRATREGKIASKWEPVKGKAVANRQTERHSDGHTSTVSEDIDKELARLKDLDEARRDIEADRILRRVATDMAGESFLSQERMKARLADACGMSKATIQKAFKVARRKSNEAEGHPDYQGLARRFLGENSLGDADSECRLRYYRQEFFLWSGRHWEPQQDDDFAARLTCFLQRLPETAARVSRNLVTNVLQNLKGLCRLNSALQIPFWVETGKRAPRLVSMSNGLVDLDALIEGRPEVLRAHTPRFFNVASVPYPFESHAKCPKFHSFLERVQPDAAVRRLLCEWLGYNMIHDTSQQRFMLLQGEGSNGKSVYSAILKALIGRGNYSAVSLSAFTAERSFCLVPTIGKLANIMTDLDFVAPKEEGRLKAFVSGEELEIERKNKDAIKEKPTARLTFACNPPPIFRDRSQAIWRRLLYVRFRVQISSDEANPQMTEEEWWEEQGELSGIFNVAVAGLKDLMTRGRFDEPETCRIDKEEYRQELNPADIFLREHCQVCPCADKGAPCGDLKHAVWTGDLYESYREWLRQAGHDNKDALSKAYFGREVKRVFKSVGLTKHARTHRVYRKQLVAGAMMDSDEIEKEVRDRMWEGLVFHAHGVPAENKQDEEGLSKGVGA